MPLLKTILLLLLLSIISIGLSAQVKIGGDSKIIKANDSSAILILEDTTKGFLLPRMTIKQRDNIKPSGPATGLVVFVNDTKDTGLYVNYGTNTKPFWIKLSNALKDTITITRIDTIFNKLITTDSIFSITSKLDTIYNKLIQTDSIFSITSKLDTIYNKLLQTDSIFTHNGRIDTLYNQISRIDTLFAKTAHFDTVAIGKLKIKLRGNYLTDSLVVVGSTDSLKKISYKQFISAIGKDTITITRIDTIYNKLITTDSIFSITSKLDTIYNKLMQTDSIFTHSGRIDTLYNQISRIDTLFAKTAHFDTVTIGKLKVRVSGSLTDSIVVVSPNDSIKRISPTRLISSTAFVQKGNTFGATAILGTRDANDLKIITNGDTLMTFKYANKSIGIGKTSPAYNLEIGGNMRCDTIYTKYVKMSADNSFSPFAVSITGGIMVVSDSKYKENIQPYTKNALNALDQIPIVSYDWKNKNITPRHVSIGVIAQDVKKILPDVVETDKAGNLSLKFNHFTYYLMKAVQELNTKTIAQEQELSAIKQQMKNIEDKNQALQQKIDKLQLMVEALIKK